MSEDQRSPASILSVLQHGEMELRGRLPWSSNATFLASLSIDGDSMDVVYKPERGERHLWDFPSHLYRREVAAYLVSEALGWDLVPETIERDGVLGEGSVQRFVTADFRQHYFTLLERPEHLGALRRIAAFDLVINNADRKGGHCLLDEDGKVWAIDHGLCFHVEPKLRTVIWDFAGEPIERALLDDLRLLDTDALSGLDGFLDEHEIGMIARRAAAVVKRGRYPAPGTGHPYPWPLV